MALLIAINPGETYNYDVIKEAIIFLCHNYILSKYNFFLYFSFFYLRKLSFASKSDDECNSSSFETRDDDDEDDDVDIEMTLIEQHFIPDILIDQLLKKKSRNSQFIYFYIFRFSYEPCYWIFWRRWWRWRHASSTVAMVKSIKSRLTLN